MTSKEIWNRKQSFELKLRNIFTIVQNSVPIDRNDILRFSEDCQELRDMIEDLEFTVNEFIGSKDYYDEIEKYKEMK